MVESLTLSLIGGLVGLALAYGGLRVLLAFAPANLPRLNDIAIDLPVSALLWRLDRVGPGLWTSADAEARGAEFVESRGVRARAG